MAFGWINSVVLGVYLIAMVGIGLLFAGRQKTAEDFFLAGRRMPWLVVGMSMFASLTSASTFVGVPEFAYAGNVAIFFGVLFSPVAAPVLILLFYRFYRRLDVTTSYDYIRLRFGSAARYVVSALFILTRVSWLGVVIYAPALVLTTITGMPLWAAILLMGVLATVYTVLGGLAAVLWTDAVQFIILVGGAVWVGMSLVQNTPGGLEVIWRVAAEHGKFDVFVVDWRFATLTAFGAMATWFFVFLHDYGTDQVTVQRLLATPDMRSTARAIIFNSISDIAINGVLLFLGIGLFSWYYLNPGLLGEDVGSAEVFPHYIMRQLPEGVSGLVITAVFAAAMSSMDSGINSISAVIVNDWVRPLRRSRSGEVALARLLTVALGVFATGAAFAAARMETVIEAWATFMGLFAGPILAVFLLGMLCRRARFAGWIVGAVAGIATTVWVRQTTAVMSFYFLPLSFVVSFAVGLAVSWVLPERVAPAGTTVWRS